MAWNEPGGGNNSNDQDPWGSGGGKRGGKQGPPDLDDALRKLQDSLNSLFGSSKRGSGGNGGDRIGGGGGIPKGLWAIAGLVVLGVWLFNAVYMVDEQEQAVILRFGEYDPETSLRHATESAVRHVVGSTPMHQVLTEGREQMAVEVTERLQRYLDSYNTGIAVTQVNIENAQAPAEVQDAFDDVIRAKEDEVRERNQAEAYANGVIPEARGKAQRMLEEANGYHDEVIARAEGEAKRFDLLVEQYRIAPEVLRERMYLDTMQDVMSNSSKILVSGGEGNNNLLYLPLDKLMQQSSATSSASGASAPTMSQNDSSRSNSSQQRDLRSRESR